MIPLDLSGKTALVCGSSQGIGRAAAMELAGLGATVILLARNADELQKVIDDLSADQGQVHESLTADFSNPAEVEETIKNRLARNRPIHILINNTGGPPPGPVSGAKPEEFTATFAQHLLCNHVLALAVLPGMKKEGYGRIINVISTSVKQPIPNLGVSNTVRAAVANWAKTLSLEVGPFGITVNNILPGATATGRLESIIANKAKNSGSPREQVLEHMMKEIPAGRFGMPEEIAYAIAFLASPAAAYINGINVPVDGGRTASL